jgi:hypothetical protein
MFDCAKNSPLVFTAIDNALIYIIRPQCGVLNSLTQPTYNARRLVIRLYRGCYDGHLPHFQPFTASCEKIDASIFSQRVAVKLRPTKLKHQCFCNPL